MTTPCFQSQPRATVPKTSNYELVSNSGVLQDIQRMMRDMLADMSDIKARLKTIEGRQKTMQVQQGNMQVQQGNMQVQQANMQVQQGKMTARLNGIEGSLKTLTLQQSLRMHNSTRGPVGRYMRLPAPTDENGILKPWPENNPFPTSFHNLFTLSLGQVRQWLEFYDQSIDPNDAVEKLQIQFAWFIGVTDDPYTHNQGDGGDNANRHDNVNDRSRNANQRGRGRGGVVNRRNDVAGGAKAGGAVAGPSGVASGNEHESSSLSPPPSSSQRNAPQTGSKRSRPTGANERPRKKAKNQNERPGRKSMRLEEQSRASTPGSILT